MDARNVNSAFLVDEESEIHRWEVDAVRKLLGKSEVTINVERLIFSIVEYRYYLNILISTRWLSAQKYAQ